MLVKRLLLAAMSVTAVADAAAQTAHSTITDSSSLYQSPTFEAGVFTGYLAGAAHEYVYDRGNKISQLNWRFDNAATVGLNLAYRPLNWLTLRGEAWTVVTSDGTLTDYDWQFRNVGINDWSDRSVGALRRMNDTYGVDLNLAATFYRFEGLSLDAVAGVRYLTMKFNAHDSSYIYSGDPEDPSSFRNQQGSLPGTNIIYQQTWYSGYFGLAMRYDMGRFGFHGQAIASPWAYGKDRDNHVLRDINFRERGEQSTMFGVQAGVDYQLAPHWTLYSTLMYEKYAQAKADMHATADGRQAFLPTGSAGLSNENWSLRVGTKFVF